jgi:hypothetical protein
MRWAQIGEMKKKYNILVGKKRRDHFVVLCLNVRIILKWILE